MQRARIFNFFALVVLSHSSLIFATKKVKDIQIKQEKYVFTVDSNKLLLVEVKGSNECVITLATFEALKFGEPKEIKDSKLKEKTAITEKDVNVGTDPDHDVPGVNTVLESKLLTIKDSYKVKLCFKITNMQEATAELDSVEIEGLNFGSEITDAEKVKASFSKVVEGSFFTSTIGIIVIVGSILLLIVVILLVVFCGKKE